MFERVLGTGVRAQRLSDVDVWIELTLADIDEYQEAPPQAHFSQDTLIDEIERRWGSDALERVATVITGGHFSPDDELRWLRSADHVSFLALVRGERQPESFGIGTDSYGA
jgi:hypothetical protein